MSACNDCDANFYIINPAGRRLVNLAMYPSQQAILAGLPMLASQIAFSDGFAICTINADGSELQYIAGMT